MSGLQLFLHGHKVSAAVLRSHHHSRQGEKGSNKETKTCPVLGKYSFPRIPQQTATCVMAQVTPLRRAGKCSFYIGHTDTVNKVQVL